MSKIRVPTSQTIHIVYVQVDFVDFRLFLEWQMEMNRF